MRNSYELDFNKSQFDSVCDVEDLPTDLSLWLSTIRLWVLRIPILLVMVHFLDVGYQAVWICMTISNFGAMIVGSILYTFVDYEPRISKLQQKVKKEVLEVNNG